MYNTYVIKDKIIISKLISYDPYHLLNSKYNELKVNVDTYKKDSVIETESLYVRINYNKTCKLLKLGE
jgi:hypothetical protein